MSGSGSTDAATRCAYRAEIHIKPHHLGPYLGHLGTAPADRDFPWIYTNPIYVEAYNQWDLSVGYDITDALAVTFEGINLTGEDVRWHARSVNHVYRLEDQQPRYALGARYKF